MRAFIYVTGLALLAFLVACNSQEGTMKRPTGDLTKKGPTPPTTQPPQNPTDNARRITAEELHKLWQKDEVLIVDTRNEPSFKQGHIRGAILIPSNDFPARADELPKNRMIVTYCT